MGVRNLTTFRYAALVLPPLPRVARLVTLWNATTNPRDPTKKWFCQVGHVIRALR